VTRHHMKVLAVAALLILTGTVGAAAKDGAEPFFVKAQTVLCQANLSVVQQAPSNLLGVPAPTIQTCYGDCGRVRRACLLGCFDETCEQGCYDQYESCIGSCP
jgi:hypothetical protein